MNKVIKRVWGVSLLATLACLLFVYASLPAQVGYESDQVGQAVAFVTRDTFFYIMLGVLSLTNVLFYGLVHYANSRFHEGLLVTLRSWSFSFATVLNAFFVVGMLFINTFNSGEQFNYQNLGYLIYFTLGLIMIWLLSFPFIVIKKLR